jgi:hypothetical protein
LELHLLAGRLAQENTLANCKSRKQSPSWDRSNPAEKTTARKYPKLCLLRKNPEIALSIHFSESEGDREYLLKRIQICDHDLTQELRSQKLQDFIDEDTQNELPEGLLEQANKLHELLTRYWSCDCTVTSCQPNLADTSRLVHLNLASIHCPTVIDRFTKFDILFAALDSSPCKWLEGEILVQSLG